ncbi:MAG: tetratricopeptide repeat protein [Acidobacteriia bacterium]|nr:tetratricopeptide repeat protein [Terriglobia bacterium]
MWPTSLLILFLAFQSNFYEQGIKALDEKRYDAAVENFINAIAAEPKDYTLFFNLALAYSLQGKDAEAVPEYKKALEMKPDLYQANLNLGISLLRLKRGPEAVPFLTSAVTEKPKEYRPNYYLGAALLSAGDFPKAEQTYAAALEIDPKSPDAELGLAHALAKQNRIADAAPHFHKAAELNPSYRDDLLELAALHEAQNQTPEAIAIYQQFPANPGAQERLGALLLASGQAADAIPPLEAAVAKSPTVANRAALATGYLKNKQPDKALPLVEEILAANPSDFDIRMLRGRITRDQRKFPDAAQDFLRAAQLKPDSPEAWSELAGALVMAEDYGPALAALDKLAALHAEKPGHVYLRAIVLDKINQREPALEAYQRFLAMSNGQSPDEEFKARQRARILQTEIRK